MFFFQKKKKHIFDFLCEMHFRTITLGKLRYAANNNGSSHKSPENPYTRDLSVFSMKLFRKKQKSRFFMQLLLAAQHSFAKAIVLKCNTHCCFSVFSFLKKNSPENRKEGKKAEEYKAAMAPPLRASLKQYTSLDILYAEWSDLIG